MKRAATPEELTHRATRAIGRVGKAISAIDNGDQTSYDALVHALRLLACHGTGNGLLVRLATMTGEPLATTVITPPPQPHRSATEPLTFALGSVPLEDVPRGQFSLPVLRVTFEELMASRCLLVNGSWADRSSQVDESFTWDRLISDIANKLGPSHVDDRVPIVFDELCRFSLDDGGTNPAAWAVRALGVAVKRCGGKLLEDLGETIDGPVPSVCAGPWGVWFGDLRIHGRIGGRVQVSVAAALKDRPPDAKLDLHWRREGEAWL